MVPDTALFWDQVNNAIHQADDWATEQETPGELVTCVVFFVLGGKVSSPPFHCLHFINLHLEYALEFDRPGGSVGEDGVYGLVPSPTPSWTEERNTDYCST